MSNLDSLRSLVADQEARMLSTDMLWKAIRNEDQRQRRRELYRTDPLWRLSKLKQNREDRLRAKVRG